jgi:hypothetical protein
MVGFSEPNHYEPRSGWRLTLAQWVQSPPGDEGSWQHQISFYWRWRTLDGMPLRACWTELGMDPATARAALAPSADSGLVPPELFSRMLARSKATGIDPNDNITDVIIAKTPPTELPDKPTIGFDAKKNLYQPRPRWKAVLDSWVEFRPPPAGSFPFQLGTYWEKRTREGKLLQQAWTELQLNLNNAETSLHPNHEHRGSIPPELIGRVVARSRTQDFNPNDEVTGIILYPELTV